MFFINRSCYRIRRTTRVTTSIHMTIVQVNHFIENYFTHNMNLNGQQQKQYNEDINTIWDDIKDFIRLHYISPRQDTTLERCI